MIANQPVARGPKRRAGEPGAPLVEMKPEDTYAKNNDNIN